ncbi:unnamed protein product, partial [Owenia fusiformis]
MGCVESKTGKVDLCDDGTINAKYLRRSLSSEYTEQLNNELKKKLEARNDNAQHGNDNAAFIFEHEDEHVYDLADGDDTEESSPVQIGFSLETIHEEPHGHSDQEEHSTSHKSPYEIDKTKKSGIVQDKSENCTSKGNCARYIKHKVGQTLSSVNDSKKISTEPTSDLLASISLPCKQDSASTKVDITEDVLDQDHTTEMS